VILLVAFLLAVFVLPSPWGVVVVAAAGLIELAEIWFFVRWSKRRHPAVGMETLVGRRAVAATPCRPRGQIRVGGEVWNAVCDMGADPGDALEVVGVDPDGLTLQVVRVPG
jgi:membrane-bound serine protease (ClpP class)